MKVKRNAWTKEEDDALVKVISENLDNLQEAFRIFHKKNPKRSVEAISTRWYSYLRVDNNVKVCFMAANKEPEPPKKQSWLCRITNLLFKKK